MPCSVLMARGGKSYHTGAKMQQLPAYIYSRISSTKQTIGVGLDRQLDNAKTYCTKHNLQVVNIQADVASAFHGKHVDGNLGQFLDAIKEKLISVPSALVVESLDRLGREHAYTALSRFIDIVQAGVEIHEISTGIVYNNKDTHLIHMAIAIMERAHNESMIKQKRAKDAIQRKLKEAEESVKKGKVKIIGANMPAWIDVIDGKFVTNDHAETVKKIYDLYISGMSTRPIAVYLTENKVPYMTPKIAKKGIDNGEYRWNSGRIMTILNSPYVYGTYTPRSGNPIEDYYPAVVDIATFMKVKEIRESRKIRGAKVNQLLTILSGCCQCAHCKHSYVANTTTRKNKSGSRVTVSMRCNGRLAGIQCKGVLIPNAVLEAYVLPLIPGIDITKLNRNRMRTIDGLKARLRSYITQQNNLLDLVQAGSATAKERFLKLEEDITKLKIRVEGAESKVVADEIQAVGVEALNSNNVVLRKKLNTQLGIMGLKVSLDCLETGIANVTMYLKDNLIHQGVLTWVNKSKRKQPLVTNADISAIKKPALLELVDPDTLVKKLPDAAEVRKASTKDEKKRKVKQFVIEVDGKQHKLTKVGKNPAAGDIFDLLAAHGCKNKAELIEKFNGVEVDV